MKPAMTVLSIGEPITSQNYTVRRKNSRPSALKYFKKQYPGVWLNQPINLTKSVSRVTEWSNAQGFVLLRTVTRQSGVRGFEPSHCAHQQATLLWMAAEHWPQRTCSVWAELSTREWCSK